MSAFWWGAFTHRHQALQLVAGSADGRRPEAGRTIARRASAALETPRKLVAGVQVTRRHREQRNVNRALIEGQRQSPEASGALVRLAHGRGKEARSPADGAAGRDAAVHGDGRSKPVDEQAMRTLLADRDEAREIAEGEPETEGRLTAMRAQLARLGERRDAAVSEGDTRRAVRLAHRGARVGRNAERAHRGLQAARRTVDAIAPDQPDHFSTEQLRERERFLEAQALLLSSAQRSGAGDLARRDYPALAGLAGLGPRKYEGLHARGKRAARLQIDRELDARAIAGDQPGDDRPVRALQGGAVARERSAGHRPAPAGSARGDVDSSGPVGHHTGAGGHARDAPSESSVMADIRAVAERRKRQLGRGRP